MMLVVFVVFIRATFFVCRLSRCCKAVYGLMENTVSLFGADPSSCFLFAADGACRWASPPPTACWFFFVSRHAFGPGQLCQVEPGDAQANDSGLD
jgi:hypothetical protein